MMNTLAIRKITDYSRKFVNDLDADQPYISSDLILAAFKELG